MVYLLLISIKYKNKIIKQFIIFHIQSYFFAQNYENMKMLEKILVFYPPFPIAELMKKADAFIVKTR